MFEMDDVSANCVKIVKTHPDAVIPRRAHDTDAGYDLISVENATLIPRKATIIPVGLKICMPSGYYCTIETNSRFGIKGMRAHRGIIDEGYTGDISPIYTHDETTNFIIPKGSKVAQLVFHKNREVWFETVEELPSTDRGEKGFGSTGR